MERNAKFHLEVAENADAFLFRARSSWVLSVESAFRTALGAGRENPVFSFRHLRQEFCVSRPSQPSPSLWCVDNAWIGVVWGAGVQLLCAELTRIRTIGPPTP